MRFKLGHITFLKVLAICAVTFGSVQLLQASEQAATVRQIAVTGNDHDLEVKITASRPVTPRMQYMTDPDRLIVDLPEARPNAGLRKIAIHRGKLRAVRVGLLSANPPVTRVVLDLVEAPEFRVLPLVNAVVVRLANSGMPERASEPARIVPVSDPPAEAKPVVTTPVAAIAVLEEPSGPGWTHWIMPGLVTTTVLAMLVIALIAHIQNRRYPRGL